MTPHAPGRYLLQITVDQELHDLMRAAQELDSHAVPSGDPVEVIKRALRAYVTRLEKRRFAAACRPRSGGRRESSSPRHIPAHVKHAVWKRDGGRCTFVGAKGHRCNARRFLEFDHVTPVARGGSATVSGVRLRCRAHNQFEAERAFGAEFMEAKREAARRRRAPMGRSAAIPRTPLGADAQRDADVLACLRSLGFRVGEARRAIEACTGNPEATLEEQVRAALRLLCPKRGTSTTVPAGVGSPPGTSVRVTSDRLLGAGAGAAA